MEDRRTQTSERPEIIIDIEDDETREGSEIIPASENSGVANTSETVNQPSLSAESSNSVGKWWFIEIWDEKRETFKAFIGHLILFIEHVILFLLAIFSLTVVDKIIKASELSPEKKHTLEEIDFYGIVACLGILTISLIIKLIILSARGIKSEH